MLKKVFGQKNVHVINKIVIVTGICNFTRGKKGLGRPNCDLIHDSYWWRDYRHLILFYGSASFHFFIPFFSITWSLLLLCYSDVISISWFSSAVAILTCNLLGGKSLLEFCVTTFLPGWQPPLIFVWFISNFWCMCSNNMTSPHVIFK